MSDEFLKIHQKKAQPKKKVLKKSIVRVEKEGFNKKGR
jgi:hypothetical protein